MPWSCAAGTKWVPIRPLVVAPQIAKPPASAQNVRVRAASRRVRMVRRTAPGRVGRHLRELAVVTAGKVAA